MLNYVIIFTRSSYLAETILYLVLWNIFLNCYREVVDVEKEAEKSDAKDEVVKKSTVEKNGDVAEEKTENGSETNGKSVENGEAEENGVSEKKEAESTESSGICFRCQV